MFENPQDFLNQNYDEPNSIKRIPPPEGEYNATLTTVSDPVSYVASKGPNAGKPGMLINMSYLLDDPNGKIEAVTNRASNTVRQTINLDCKWDSQGKFAGLDMRDGMNIGLGILREATGLNGSGFSFSKLVGKHVTVNIKHVKDERDGQMQAEVRGVTKLGETLKKEKK